MQQLIKQGLKCKQNLQSIHFTRDCYFWNLNGVLKITCQFWTLEHCQRDFRVPVKIPRVYWRYKAMNFSLYYRIKYFKKTVVSQVFWTLFFQFMCLFRNEKQHPFRCRSLQREIRMFISFSETDWSRVTWLTLNIVARHLETEFLRDYGT